MKPDASEKPANTRLDEAESTSLCVGREVGGQERKYAKHLNIYSCVGKLVMNVTQYNENIIKWFIGKDDAFCW